MTVLTRDDLLGASNGPMIPPDEAAATGRESLTLVPEGTFVTYRRNPAKMGALYAGPNAYNTGRVKVLTTNNAERNMPADGGTEYDAQNERMKSYRTHAETYKFQPYGADKPVIGPKKWPAKQLFPLTPDIERVDAVEHDIVPGSSETSAKDSVVKGTDSDADRGFVAAKEMKGDLGMLYGLNDDAFSYGRPDGGVRNVDSQDLLTLVAWDDQSADWQLGATGRKVDVAALAVKRAQHAAKKALVKASQGHFKNVEQAVDWIRKTLLMGKIRKGKNAGTLVAAVQYAGDQAINVVRPKLAAVLGGAPMSDYLQDWPDTEDFNNLNPGNWGRSGHDFTGLRGLGDDVPGIVTSLDADPPKAAAVTNAATATVNKGIQTGAVPSDTASIAQAISNAAQAAAAIYSASQGKPIPPANVAQNTMAKVGAAIMPVDQPFYKKPLFWGGVALLAVGGTALALKGGSGGGGTRRRSTTRRYRRNTFPTFNGRRRGFKSRWA